MPLPRKYAQNCKFFFYKLRTMIALSPEQRLACQRTFIVSTEIHYNINNCAFPAKLDSYHTSAVDPVLGTQNRITSHLKKVVGSFLFFCTIYFFKHFFQVSQRD